MVLPSVAMPDACVPTTPLEPALVIPAEVLVVAAPVSVSPVPVLVGVLVPGVAESPEMLAVPVVPAVSVTDPVLGVVVSPAVLIGNPLCGSCARICPRISPSGKAAVRTLK